MIQINCDITGIRVETNPSKGLTPLHLAAKYGHLETVKVLCEKNADIHARISGYATPLYLAAKKNHTAVVEFLEKQGAKSVREIDLEMEALATQEKLYFGLTRYDMLLAFLFPSAFFAARDLLGGKNQPDEDDVIGSSDIAPDDLSDFTEIPLIPDLDLVSAAS